VSTPFPATSLAAHTAPGPELEAQRWTDFVRELGAQLAALWPSMPERLTERYPAFIELAVEQAEQAGLQRAAAVARYVNLVFVWGPGFQGKPGFEWAKALLAAAPGKEWACLHRLVQRSMAQLEQLPNSPISAQALSHADERLIQRFGALGVRGAMQPADPPAAPSRACDIDAFELRVLSLAVAQHYEFQGGQWMRQDLPEPLPIRVTASVTAGVGVPRLAAVLSHDAMAMTRTMVQLRLKSLLSCDAEFHPAVEVGGSHGRWRWQGHASRAQSWPVSTLAQPGPAAGPGTAVAEETSPDILRLDLQCCGLRDDADAFGPLQLPLWVWPAAQWWLELQRSAAPLQSIAVGKPLALAPVTRSRVECDALAQDAAPLRLAFERGLDAQCSAALQALLAAWSALPGLSSPQLEAQLSLLTGRAALSWGWKLPDSGLDGRALMRLVGELKLLALECDLAFTGEWAWGDARARITLRCTGGLPLEAQLRREAAEPPLLALLPQLQARFRLPLLADLDPLASDSGAVLQAAGPCKGALVGEAGLRPRTSGGSGWEWYALLRLEAVSLPVQLMDPLLGRQQRLCALLAPQALVDWRLG